MNSELRIFVYGTLKKGFSNHESYCKGVLRIVPATLRGRLYKLLPDIPVMIVPDSVILASGSADIGEDMRLLAQSGRASRAEAPGNEISGSDGNWNTINGEILFFGDPEKRLPLVDSLEEFRPGEASTYLRVLLEVLPVDGPPLTVWTYVAGFDTAGLEEYEGKTWYPDE